MLKRDPKKLFLRYAKKGDAAALGKVFDLMAPELLGLALHLTRRTDLAEDVLQDTFLAAAESAQRFDSSREFPPWIIGILVNRARKVREAIATSRLRAVEDEQLAAAASDGRSATTDDPSKEAEAKEVRHRVAAAIGSLEAPYREVVEAHLTGGLPPREIAPALGRTPGTVRVQLHRGLEQLRSLLASREGIGGLEMLSLAPTSAMMFSSEAGRGLSVIKAEILASLPGKSVAVAGASAGAAGGTMGMGMSIAAGAVLIGAGAWVANHFSSGETSRGPDAVEIAQVETPGLAPAANLAPVDDRERRSPTAAPEPASPKPPRESSRFAPKKPKAARKKSSTTEAKPSEMASSGPKFTFRIEPSIDRTAVETFSAFGVCGFHARSRDRQAILGAGTAVYNDFRGFSIGKFASSADLPHPLIVRFDHPDALPVEVSITPADWSSQLDGYVARPVLHLDKIEMELFVTAGTLDRGGLGRPTPFEGEAILLSFDSLGLPQLHDRKPLLRGKYEKEHRRTRLRTPLNLGSAMILGIPTSPDLFTDVTEVHVSPGMKKGVHANMRPRFLPPIEFVLNDPFRRPMKDIPLRAVVPDEAIVVRDPDSNGPLLFEGRVFCLASDNDVSQYGRTARNGGTVSPLMGITFGAAQSLPRPIALLPTIEGTTDKTGRVTLTGVVLGIHQIEVKSPLTDEWTKVSGSASTSKPRRGSGLRRNAGAGDFTYTLKAPVAGLEIERPVDLAEAPSVWKSAKIQLSGRGFEKQVKPTAGTRVRTLIPPNTSLMVNVHAGDQEYATLSRGVPAGGRHLVAPLLLNHRKKGRPARSSKAPAVESRPAPGSAGGR